MSSLSVARFKAAFPEFENATDALVQAKIDDAEGRLNERVFGTLWTQAVMYQTAHLLAASPFGRKMRLTDGATSIYEGDLKLLRKMVTSGYRAVGEPTSL